MRKIILVTKEEMEEIEKGMDIIERIK